MSPFLTPSYIIAVLIAISVHEWAHAYVAHRLGDPTAEREGRLTLNPLSHLDPIGAILFLIVGFGWAKPVPVNAAYFSHPKRGMALVAAAGPFSNLILAALSFGLLAVLSSSMPGSAMSLLSAETAANPLLSVLMGILQGSLFVNLALMAFNLFPLAPLDGSNVLRAFIPLRYEERYEDFVRIGPFILLGLLVVESFLPIRILSGWVFGIVNAVLEAFLTAASVVL